MNLEEIESMVSLLGDRSIRVRNRVATCLEKTLPESEEALKTCAEKEEDPLIREKLEMMVKFAQSENPVEHWRVMKEHMNFNLRDGMAAIGFLDAQGGASRVELLTQIDHLSDEWFRQLPEKSSPDEQVQNLMAFLFGENSGFTGNTAEYYSLENCFLHHVLNKKKGLPVTLSVLAIILAEEAELTLFGIALPLHFIVGHFQGQKGIRFYDCFDGGREVNQDECVQYLHSRGIFFHPQLLSPCDNETILNRVLVNIKHICQRKGYDMELQQLESLTESKELPTI